MAATLSSAITTCLQRVRLSTSVSVHQDQARKYLSLAAAEIFPLVPWDFLDRTTTFLTTETFTLSGTVGAFTSGETITGGTSGSTAVVDHYDATNGKVYVYTISAAFTASETITGGSSEATATYASTAETRVYTPVSGPVTNWWSFHDVTNEYPLEIVGPDLYDLADIDRSETGKVVAVYIAGLDADTGYPVIELYRTPGTTNETIRVRYRMDIAEWGSGDDGTTLMALGISRIFESVILYGAEALYLEQERHYSAARLAWANKARALLAAIENNRRNQGSRRYPARESGGRGADLTINVGTDLASAA